MKLFSVLAVTICLCVSLSVPQGLDEVGIYSFTSSNKDDMVRLINATAEQPNETSFKTDKPDEGSELNHSKNSSANEKKETDADLKPEAVTLKGGLLDEGWQEFFVTDKPVSPSKPSTNETEVVYVDDDEKVKKVEKDLERNLEEFEEFEESATNSSKSNDTKEIVDAPTKEVIKKTDIEDTESFEENNFENGDELKDDPLMQTGVSFKTTEASDLYILTPWTPSPRSIPMDDSNAVKEAETSKVTENEVSSTTTEFSAKFTTSRPQERRPTYVVRPTFPVGDPNGAKDAESPKVLTTEVYAKPTESSKVRFIATKPAPTFMSTPILEATLYADSIENVLNSTLPYDADLKIGTAKIDLDTDDKSSSPNSSTIQVDKVPGESKEINLPEDYYSLSNDLKKNEFSTDTDFHVVESVTENQEIERVAEVNDTLLNETMVSENSSEVICPQGYRCVPLSQTSKEVCLSLIHIYIFSGSIAGFLVVALTAIFLRLRCRKNSSSLYDIPHLNIKSDYNLTPIPRPSINHHDREYPSFGTESYSRPRGEESVLNPRHFNTSVPDEFMESKSVPKSKLHTFGRSGSKKSEANSSCNEYYSLDTWKDKEPLRKQGMENLGFRKW